MHSAELLATRWQRLGNPSRAIDVLERFAGSEKGRLDAHRAGDPWLEAARSAWWLAESLRPAQAVRRPEVLMWTLADPRAAPQISPDDQAWRAEVGAALAAKRRE